MGNSGSRNPSRGTGKVVFWDGTVQELDNMHLTAAELMLDHPQQVVVELQSAVSGKRARPLPADERLDESKVYLMLPVRRGKPASLSTEEARQVLLIASSALRSRNSSGLLYWGFLPLLARVCTAGLRGDGRYIHVPVDSRKKGNMDQEKEEKVMAVVGQGRWQPEVDFADVLEGRPEYLSRQLSGKGWKPSLDTIVEKKIENRVSHWLFSS
ncbi:uncharacterized protein LOC116211720 [Punica granatum]|uniref:Uncharacterized protein LOC116211720 n=1 Tax=Punica granatum TaxID=22663 RepID=A0A218XNM0_PUNGR|nr:uncharacterized protein LOC116211720 [Punica granatum]OWM86091.1 hypothetical protein CDL15_Pgr010915 [Punica granatum]